jgi:hypothetical protein
MSLTKATYSMVYGAPVNILDFGAVGNGVVDDTAAIQSAFNSGSRHILIPPGTYRITSTLTLTGNGYRIVQAGNLNAVLLKDFNGAAIQWNAGEVIWENCCIDGQGTIYTGASQVGILVGTGGGYSSKLISPRIWNIGSACIRFDQNAGNGFSVISGLLEPLPSTQAAIDHTVNTDTQPASRTIFGVQSGNVLIDFASMETTLVSSCITNFIRYGATTKKASVIGCRIQNATTGSININGTDNLMVGNIISGNVDVTNTAHNPLVMNNLFASGYGLLNSGNIATAVLDQTNISYTPVWSASGTQPVLGNGSIFGFYDRNGSDIHAYGILIMGSTTTYGSGTYRFSLPFTNAGGTRMGTGVITDSGVSYYTGIVLVDLGAQYVEMTIGGTGAQVRQGVPVTFTAGDVIRWDITYRCKS